jgi:hypothetical protein
MDKICNLIDEIFRRLKTTMNGKSFIDLGAGGNRLAGHIAARYPRAKVAMGIECQKQRTGLAAKVIKTAREDTSPESKAHAWAPCTVVSANIMKLTSLLGFDVWMAFDSAFPLSLMKHIARLWNESDAIMLILFTNPAELTKLGFAYWKYEGIVDHLSMKGSGEGKTAHIYTRDTQQNLPQELPPFVVEDGIEEEEDDDNTTSPEERIRQAVVLCKYGPRADFINYLQCTFEEGLRTARSVALPNGKVVSRSIRVRKPIKRLGQHVEEVVVRAGRGAAKKKPRY